MVDHPRCEHGLVLCSQCVVVSDAARRMADQINNRLAFSGWEIRNSWMAFKLDDGSTTGTLYDSRIDAVRHCDEKYHAFFCFRNALSGVTPKDCQIFLNMNRHAYDAGGHLVDPDAPNGGVDLILPSASYDKLTNRIRARKS